MLSFANLHILLKGIWKLTLGEGNRLAVKPLGTDPGEQELIRKHS